MTVEEKYQGTKFDSGLGGAAMRLASVCICTTAGTWDKLDVGSGAARGPLLKLKEHPDSG